MKIYTIGFTKKPARQFFGLLREAAPKRVVDVRLNNVSQLAGFAKKDDLEYFLAELCGIEYVHVPLLSPSQDILDDYRKRRLDWAGYEERFLALLKERAVEQAIPREVIADGCLLCSEESPDRCHRRLVAEYLREQWGDIEIVHLR